MKSGFAVVLGATIVCGAACAAEGSGDASIDPGVVVSDAGAPDALGDAAPDCKLANPLHCPEFVSNSWHVYALEYAHSEGVPLSQLLQVDDQTPTGMSWNIFVLLGHHKVLLVDAGSDFFPQVPFYQTQWKITSSRSVTETLTTFGIAPSEVDDVIPTHHHGDHADGLVVLPNARVHMPPGEVTLLRDPARSDARTVAYADTIEKENRFVGIDASPYALTDGILVWEKGRHTEHHVSVEVTCADRSIVLVSDAAYLFRAVEEKIPIAVSTSAEGNVADVQEFRTRVTGKDAIVPGHDPAIYTRYAAGQDAHTAVLCP